MSAIKSAVVNTAYLRLAFSVSVVPIGMITNTLAAYLFCRKALNSKDSKNGYMNAFLCLYNMLALSNAILFVQLLPYYNISILSSSDPACKILWVWLRVWVQAPSWHQCLISLLFYLSIKYPTKSRFMYKTKFIAASMTIMILGLILLNMENFWFYLDGYFKTTYSFDSSTNRTVNKTVYVTTACTASVQLSMASDFVNIFSRSFIPFIILTVLTGLLLYHVAKVRRNITDSTNTKKNGKSQVRFGRILIFLNILFLVLYLPWALSFIISYTITSRGVRLTSAGDSTDPNILYFYNISLCLSYCFNASPFFVNLAFNKLFKQEFLNLFCAYKMTSKFAFTRGITKSLT